MDQNQTSPTQAELLDHEYDGIREFDNPTPGWWHLIFLGSILFMFPYILVFHFSPGGCSIYDQFDKEMADFYRAKFARLGTLEPNAETIVGLSKNPEAMLMAEGTFKGKCASCHGANGEGLVGPNLTDQFYKNATSIEDLYRVLDEGVISAGMPAWGRQLHPSEVVLITAYAASLRGKELPGPKGPEGDQIAPWPDHPMFEFESGESAQ